MCSRCLGFSLSDHLHRVHTHSRQSPTSPPTMSTIYSGHPTSIQLVSLSLPRKNVLGPIPTDEPYSSRVPAPALNRHIPFIRATPNCPPRERSAHVLQLLPAPAVSTPCSPGSEPHRLRLCANHHRPLAASRHARRTSVPLPRDACSQLEHQRQNAESLCVLLRCAFPVGG